jgi:hypothetical protein
MTKPRDYKAEYANYHGKPEQIKKRAMRVQARRDMTAKVGAAALKGKDVDHKTPLRSGGGNGAANLRISSVKANRGWRKGS